MASRAPLRAVKDGDKPAASKRKKTVAQAAADGNVLELLVAMRDRIARTVSDPKCPPRDLASLSRRLQEITKEIEALNQQAKEDGSDASTAEDEAWDAEAL